MKVRIKVKHLIYALIVLFGLLPVLSNYMQPQNEMKAIDDNVEAGNITKAKLQVEKLLQQKITKEQKWMVIQKYMIESALAQRFDVYIGPTMSSWSSTSTSDVFTVEETIPYLLDYVKDGPVDGYMGSAAEQLAYYYQRQGDYERADQILVDTALRARANKEDFLADELYSKRIEIDFDTKKFAKAATIEGRIMRSDGKPMANVGVFLRDESSVNSSVSDDERFQTMTDQNGYFQFTGVIPGSYQIHLGVKFEQIDGWTWSLPQDDWINVTGADKLTYDIEFNPLMAIHSPVNNQEIRADSVEFKWEKVEGANHYNLNLCLEFDNGSTCSSFKSKIKTNELTAVIEDLYKMNSGIMYSGEGSPLETVQPGSLLAFANPKGEFSWYVEAFDQEGNLITKSNGYRLNKKSMGKIPIFYLKGRELTHADQLLLDRKILAALKQYKQAVKENPRDIHSLRMVVRLIGFENENGDFDHRKIYSESVLPYLQALAEQQPSGDTIFSLLAYFYEKRDWDSYEEWYEKYEQYQVYGDQSDYVQSIHATAQMRQGNLDRAREMLYNVMEIDPTHRFVGNLIAIELYLNPSSDKALQVAKKYPERDYDSPDWVSVIESLTSVETRHLNEALELYFFAGDNDVRQHANKQANSPLGNLLEALLNVS